MASASQFYFILYKTLGDTQRHFPSKLTLFCVTNSSSSFCIYHYYTTNGSCAPSQTTKGSQYSFSSNTSLQWRVRLSFLRTCSCHNRTTNQDGRLAADGWQPKIESNNSYWEWDCRKSYLLKTSISLPGLPNPEHQSPHYWMGGFRLIWIVKMPSFATAAAARSRTSPAVNKARFETTIVKSAVNLFFQFQRKPYCLFNGKDIEPIDVSCRQFKWLLKFHWKNWLSLAGWLVCWLVLMMNEESRMRKYQPKELALLSFIVFLNWADCVGVLPVTALKIVFNQNDCSKENYWIFVWCIICFYFNL